MNLASLAPAWHRSYVRSHPIGLLSALGIALGGFVGLFFPEAVDQSAASLTLPGAVLTLFYVVWLVGGTAAFIGILRGILRLHVPGMMLLAGGLLAYYGIIVSIRGWSGALQVAFVGLLGLGCGLHALNLIRCGGYDGIEHR